MTPTQSPTLASQATAELPKLPPPLIRREDFPAFQAKIAMNCYSAVQMDHRWREGYEAGRESRAQSEWQPIETAPKEGRTMFVVRGFDVTDLNCGARRYTTDPYCVWPGDEGGWVRWPHVFPPTHWMPLPATLGETK